MKINSFNKFQLYYRHENGVNVTKLINFFSRIASSGYPTVLFICRENGFVISRTLKRYIRYHHSKWFYYIANNNIKLSLWILMSLWQKREPAFILQQYNNANTIHSVNAILVTLYNIKNNMFIERDNIFVNFFFSTIFFLPRMILGIIISFIAYQYPLLLHIDYCT